MENKLAEALVLKGVLSEGTEVEAYYSALGLGGINSVRVTGYFSVVSATKRPNGDVMFVLAALRDGAETTVLAEDILNIDGMDPVRFASVYDIKACGGAAELKARRGRKPKDRSPEGLARAAALAAAVLANSPPEPANDDDDDFDDREVA